MSVQLSDELRAATASLDMQLAVLEEEIRAQGRDRSGANAQIEQIRLEIDTARAAERKRTDEVAGLEDRIREIREQLRKLNEQHEKFRKELEAANAKSGQANNRTAELERAYSAERRRLEKFDTGLNDLVEQKQDLEVAHRRARIGALFSYLAKIGRSLEAAMQGSHEASKAAKARQAFEEARHRDPQVMSLFEARVDLRKLLPLASVQEVRGALQAQLRDIEAEIEKRFPRALSAPATLGDTAEIEELFYRSDGDTAVVLLPVRDSEWNPAEPAALASLRLTWALSKALGLNPRDGEMVAVGDFLGLRVPLDHCIKAAPVMPLPDGRTVSILLSQVPAQIEEAMRREGTV